MANAPCRWCNHIHPGLEGCPHCTCDAPGWPWIERELSYSKSQPPYPEPPKGWVEPPDVADEWVRRTSSLATMLMLRDYAAGGRGRHG